MATYKVDDLISRASILLQDSTNVRWPTTELLGWLNDGQREIVAFKPNTFVVNASIPLSAGTKQVVPAAAIALIDVVRNMGPSPGNVPGNVIRAVSREILDAQVPDWHMAAKATAVVKHFIYSLLDPKNFYVYPPQIGSPQQYVEIVYAAAPTDAVAGGVNVISIDDVYASALLNYMMFRAYSKDAEYAANAALAKTYFDTFQMQLGGKATAEGITNPMQSLSGFNPNVPATGK